MKIQLKLQETEPLQWLIGNRPGEDRKLSLLTKRHCLTRFSRKLRELRWKRKANKEE
jgi:hypothetical protein